QRQQAIANSLAERKFEFMRQQANQPQIVKTKGLLGEETQLYDPITRKLTPLTGGPGVGGPGGAPAPVGENYDDNGVDKAYLEAVRKKYGDEVANSVQAMSEGRMPTAGFGAIKPLVPLAARYKQGFDASTYLQHLQAEKAFQPGGKYAEKARAINQATMH